MPTVKNLSYGPISIVRAEKDPLTLGPRESADISDVEFGSDEIQRLLRDRRIAVVPGAAQAGGGGGRPRSNEGRGSGASTPTPSE
jgi:hypothetical protein